MGVLESVATWLSGSLC